MMTRRFLLAAMICCSMAVQAQAQTPMDVTKRPFLTVLADDGAGTVKVYRGRYYGEAQIVTEAPADGMYAARILVKDNTGEKLVDGWCFGSSNAPLDVTKRPFVSILVTDPNTGDVYTARGHYVGTAEDLVDEPPVEGMVSATILTFDTASKTHMLLKGWAFPDPKDAKGK